MDRRAFLGTLALVATPLAAKAQQAGKVHRVGYLSAGARESQEHIHKALLRGLVGRGWIEGQNLIVERRWGEGRNEHLPALATELVQHKVDVIVTVAEPATLAARGMTFTPTLELLGKRLALLKEAAPHASRVVILSNPANPSHVRELEAAQAAAPSMRLQLRARDARRPEEFDRVFSAMARERADGLLVLTDTMFNIHRARLAELAAIHRLPTMYGIREFVVAGGLMAYGVNLVDYVEGAALYVDRILKGAKPADLPVEQPTKFELVINLKTAKALGLTIPPSLLQRADQVIE